jgi:sialate O-acetylesterase
VIAHIIVSLAASLAADVTPARAILSDDFQVLQRGDDGRGSCVVVLPADARAGARFVVAVEGDRGQSIRRVEAASIALAGAARGVPVDGLPTGGPYAISVAAADRPDEPLRRFRHVLVGDIWVLGGQSNMFGIDLVRENLPALPAVNMLDVRHLLRDAHWSLAVPPIHRIPEPFATFTLKAQHPDYSDERVRSIIASGQPVGGIDCSYFFAHKLHAESGVPIGLIPCAIGGSLSLWDPRERDSNRYGFVLHHIESVGGRIKGVLFFQGEQDAIFGDEIHTVTKPSAIGPLSTYGDRFIQFIEALRDDVHDPAMPVIFAQISRHHNGPPGRARAWELIRETQRRIPERLRNSHCIPSIDLDVMDGLHLGYDSHARMGERMARLAVPYVKKGVPPRAEIRLKSVERVASPRPCLVVKYSGVSGRLRAPGRPTGFVLKQPDGETLDWIFKVELDPEQPGAVILRTTALPGPGVALYYGAGPAPYVNIVDEADMPLPAFGPITPE